MNVFDQQLLDDFQRDFPLVSRPFAVIGERVGMSEPEVIDAYKRFAEERTISRIGAIIKPGAVGASTLAAMAVPLDRLDEVAGLVSSYDEVNHNYAREHAFNMWFVVAATDAVRVHAVLAEITEKTGLAVMNLPILEDFHLDLGFKLQWN
jgi:DNA-binding Lrp family transcriptional regulator